MENLVQIAEKHGMPVQKYIEEEMAKLTTYLGYDNTDNDCLFCSNGPAVDGYDELTVEQFIDFLENFDKKETKPRVKWAYFKDTLTNNVVKIAVGASGGTRYCLNGRKEESHLSYNWWVNATPDMFYPITYKEFKSFLENNGHIKPKKVNNNINNNNQNIKVGDIVKYNGNDLLVMLVTDIRGDCLDGIVLDRGGFFSCDIGSVQTGFGLKYFDKISPKW